MCVLVLSHASVAEQRPVGSLSHRQRWYHLSILDMNHIAYHAGGSKWNANSIGVEIASLLP